MPNQGIGGDKICLPATLPDQSDILLQRLHASNLCCSIGVFTTYCIIIIIENVYDNSGNYSGSLMLFEDIHRNRFHMIYPM